MSSNGHKKLYDLPSPTPDLSPEDVVGIILDALQHNDQPCEDCGIETTFNFASPENRALTGPLPRFAEMVKNAMYGPMLNFQRSDYDLLHLTEDRAELRVEVTDSEGTRAGYLFVLTRQAGPAFQNCWMTDAVVRIE